MSCKSAAIATKEKKEMKDVKDPFWIPCTSAEDEVLIAALNAGWSYSQAAEMAGVRVAAVRVRMVDPTLVYILAVRREHIEAAAAVVTLIEPRYIDEVGDELVNLSDISRLAVARGASWIGRCVT